MVQYKELLKHNQQKKRVSCVRHAIFKFFVVKDPFKRML
jgi:hypothetical protein